MKKKPLLTVLMEYMFSWLNSHADVAAIKSISLLGHTGQDVS